MLLQFLIFTLALTGLLIAARYFTTAAEQIGFYFKMPAFIIGVFIVGIGTSLPELVSGVISVSKGVSEILPGNIMGANISNILLITGLVAYLNRKDIVLTEGYIFVHLHYLLGAFFILVMMVYDGEIKWLEALVGLFAFLAYSFYLIKPAEQAGIGDELQDEQPSNPSFPLKALITLLIAGVGIYFGANYTVSSISNIAQSLQIAPSIIALTLLSIGTTLPELAVNVSAIRKGNAEMAIGNVLGSCIFNTLTIPAVASWFGPIHIPGDLLAFSLPVMLGSGLFFYLLTQDRRISRWEGILFMLIYGLFLLKIAGVA
ncbi:calcium/sodium antiporter [Haliscomenobacter hydrossis]|uniref:Na+/Ca+ antiporter, CaCA family n=1 Tax=Haliscomenobacter hydrossis (strain ATCC 27775 / DSM 1100 / LMG 10767 / O) TaxID=760192 RepID=F4L4I6_HALH1|nr:calcium/sodium antiporter [Haliscomenobacter hydrossis]AEE51987.1 Na+/Ca+ antiporter, CaCA family [Haliscomenobacter hydrossis DSM 1100]